MEEDIKRCRELIKPEHSNWIGITNQTALENLIKGYRELEERNKQCIKAGDLERAVGFLMNRNDLKDYIPKSKIKEKMKKYEWALNDYDCSNADSKHSQCIGRYMALQELLEEE